MKQEMSREIGNIEREFGQQLRAQKEEAQRNQSEQQRIDMERQRDEQRFQQEEDRMKREMEMQEERMKREMQMDEQRMRMEEDRMRRMEQGGGPGMGPGMGPGGQGPQGMAPGEPMKTRGFLMNPKPGSQAQGFNAAMDPTMLAMIGIAITVLATGLTLFKGN